MMPQYCSGYGRMLLHSANAEWMDTIGRHERKNPTKTDKDWEMFKMCTADYITRVVYKQDAYD